MQITVPTNLDNHPQVIIIGGVSYTLEGGATIDVPDAVAAELYRKIAAQAKPNEPVDLPWTDGAINTLNTAVGALDTRVTDVEAAVLAKELPDFPESDGTYALQLVVDDGVATLSWEAAEDSGGDTDPPK